MQRLKLPQLVADGKFHHLEFVRRPSQDPEVMQIGLILAGQHEAWITDASDGHPIAFNQGAQPDWEIRNTVGGRWRESRVSNGFHGVIDQIEITATR